MSDVRSWLAGRTPPAPAPLARWIGKIEYGGGSVLDGLVEGGLAELDRARSAPGRVRESAFHLLAADALLTYACEAALESPEPSERLGEILRKAAADER